MKRTECLESAAQIVTGQREDTHGAMRDTFDKITRLWTAYLINRGLMPAGSSLEDWDAPLMMDLMKTARVTANSGHVDSWVDKAGYAACGCEIATEGKA